MAGRWLLTAALLLALVSTVQAGCLCLWGACFCWNPPPPPPGPPSGFTGYVNNWDGVMDFSCGTSKVVEGAYSVHDNRREDRRWAFKCTTLKTNYQSSGNNAWRNNWDGQLDFTCPNNYAINGFYSTHNNRKEDRLWKIRCGRVTDGASLGSASLTHQLNNWDGKLDYTAPTGRVFCGAKSNHDDRKEDRLWRFRTCQVNCASPWLRSAEKCYCPSWRAYQSGANCYTWSKCTAGKYQSVKPSGTRNRGCSSCQAGKYQDQSSHTSTACKSCPAGKVQSRTGQSGCVSCSSPSYQPQSGQKSCVTTCTKGYYRYSVSSQRKCPKGYKCNKCTIAACPVGQYQGSSGQTSCSTCPSTMYQDQTAQSGCKYCLRGQYRASSSTQKPCPAGYRCTSCSGTNCRTSCTRVQCDPWGRNPGYQAQSGQDHCDPITFCGKGQGERTRPTTTSNRVCANCVQGQTYQEQTSHSSACKSVSSCGSGQYVKQAPTRSSNRVCAGCQTGKYQDQSNQDSCKSWRVCSAGTYQTVPPSSTRNRGCGNCPTGTFQDQSGQTGCKKHAGTCSAGKYQSSSPTSTSNRVCSNCPSGKYQDQANQGSCKNVRSACAAGTYQAAGPTTSTNRVCHGCDGTSGYQDQTGQSKCKAVTVCGAGRVQVQAATPTSDRICTACLTSCPQGQYVHGSCSATQSTACRECHQNCLTCTGPASSECLTCKPHLHKQGGLCVSDCADGSYADDDKVCRPCDSSCYDCNNPGSSSCTRCTGSTYLSAGRCVTTCPSGHFKSNSPNNNICRQCRDCSPSQFGTGCSGTRDRTCTTAKVCSPGQYEATSHTATTDTVCAPCSLGQSFQPHAGRSFCQAVSTCEAGTFVSTPATLTEDVDCSPCAAGRHTTDENEDSCDACPAGTFQNLVGQASCKDCGPTMFSSQQGATSCHVIQAGYYGVGGTPTTSTGQQACPIGYACVGGSITRTPCNGVTDYQDKPGQTQCKPVTQCSAGKYQSKAPTVSSDRVCSSCPSGKASLGIDGACVDWIDCEPGTFETKPPTASSQRECSPCREETFQPASNKRFCESATQCPAGTYVERALSPTLDRKCAPCTLGVDYQNLAGKNSCKPVSECEVGQMVSVAATVSSDTVCGQCNGITSYQNVPGAVGCLPVEDCVAGEYETAGPTPTSDRVCLPCPSGQYNAASSHTLKSCTPWTVCTKGTAETRVPSATQNRACAACVAGDSFSTVDEATECTEVKDCGPGQFESAPPTRTSDRVCAACPANTYQDAGVHHATSCKAVSTCKAGQYVRLAPTASSDRVCGVCDSDTYSTTSNAATCAPSVTCSAGQYETTAPTRTSNRVCASCTSTCRSNEFLLGSCGGTDVANAADDADIRENPVCQPCDGTCAKCSGPGAAQCTACHSNLVLHDGECRSDCPDGKYASNGACRSCQSKCFACEDGTSCTRCSANRFFSNGDCVLQCPSGSYGKSLDAASTNNQCLPCNDCGIGSYTQTPCSATADVQCQPVSVCAAGTRQTAAATSTTDTKCSPCVKDTSYQPLRGETSCIAVSDCPAGEFVSAAATVTSDRVCAQCPQGQFSNTKNSGSCSQCTPGKFQPTPGSNSCLNCGASSYQPEHGATSCVHIEPGFYGVEGPENNPEINVAVQKCPAGSFCLGEASPKQTCAPGTYQDQDGQDSCEPVTLCAQGESQVQAPTTSSNRVCSACVSGKFQDASNHGETECEDYTVCAPGSGELRAPTRTSDRVCAPCGTGSFADPANPAAGCQRVTVCGPGTKETSPPTASSDRTCQACPDGQFQALAGQTTCSAWTVCGPGSRVASTPSKAQDRVCAACNGVTEYQDGTNQASCKPVEACSSGEFEEKEPTPTSDAVCLPCPTGEYQDSNLHSQSSCKPWATCAAGSHQTRAPSKTQNRLCQSCVLGLTYQPNPNAEKCLAVQQCQPGHFALSEPSLVANRGCTACPADTYLAVENVRTSCLPKRTCPAGQRMTSPGSGTADRSCAPCPANTYNPHPNTATCTDMTVCPTGTYIDTPGTPLADRICSPCTVAADCTDNEFLAGTCAGSEDARCAPCHPSCSACTGPGIEECTRCDGTDEVLHEGRCEDECPTKKYATAAGGCLDCDDSCADCSGPAPTQCTRCSGALFLLNGECLASCPTTGVSSGTYGVKASGDNDNTCVPCTQCAPEQFAQTSCGGLQNTVCRPWTVCAAGTYQTSPPSLEADRECEACPAGRYQPHAGQVHCVLATTCQPGEKLVAAATATTDTTCEACPSGTHQEGTNQATCEQCDPGTKQPSTGQRDCVPCGPGEYQSESGKTFCEVIATGEFGTGGDSTTHTGVSPCQPGFACPGGSVEPIACDGTRTYQNEGGQASCKVVDLCPSGDYQTAAPTPTSNRKCDACPDGYTPDYLHDRTECIPHAECGVGQHVEEAPDAQKDRECDDCNGISEYQNEEGAESCKPVTSCTPGKYQTLAPTPAADRECATCAAGKYQDAVNQHGCVPTTVCQEGFKQSVPPTTSTDRRCTFCGAHEYQDQPGQTSCKPVLRCAKGEFQSLAPTPATNRECAACPAGKFQAVDNSAFTSCTSWTQCSRGQYETTPPTATNDRTCADCTPGTSYSDVVNAPSCTPVTTCSAGEEEITAPTLVSNRRCTDCVLGVTYMDEDDHDNFNCKPVTDCKIGEFQLRAPTLASDRVCSACDGTNGYQNEPGKTQCKETTTCTQAEYLVTQPTPSSDRVCARCTTSDDCRSDEFLKGTCGGTQDAAADGDERENPRCIECWETCASCTARAADACTSCPPGWQLDAGVCVSDCDDGKYADGVGCSACDSSCATCSGGAASDCVSCKSGAFLDASAGTCGTVCPEGTYKHDGRCEPCTVCSGTTWASTPCHGSDDAVCSPWHECAVGQKQKAAPTHSTDRTCESCEVGKEYQDQAGQLGCKPAAVCRAPDRQEAAPTASTDRICVCDREACARRINALYAEELCAKPDNDQLEAGIKQCCDGDTEDQQRNTLQSGPLFAARHNCEGCQNTGCGCDAGYALVTKGLADVCEACEVGTSFSPAAGASKCTVVTVCGRGDHELVAPTTTSDRVCSKCPEGSVDHDESGTSTCEACDPGTYVREGQHGSCNDHLCPAGTADLDSNPATECDACPPGTYQPARGQTSCLPVEDCPAGAEQSAAPTASSPRQCKSCLLGHTYKSSPGQATECEPVSNCAAGYEQTQAPTTSTNRVCTPCDPGTTYKRDAGNDAKCAAVSDCAAGEEQSDAPTISTDRRCRDCQLGATYKAAAGQASACVEVDRCTDTEFEAAKATLTSDVVCKALTTCKDGEYEALRPTRFSDRVCSTCTVCPTGSKFELHPCGPTSDTQCNGCTSCPQGQYLTAACDEDSQTQCAVCDACTDQEYETSPCTTDLGGNRVCTPLTDCAAEGKYISKQATLRTDRECASPTVCGDDQYESKPMTTTSDRQCTDITVCPSGSEPTNLPGATTDRGCRKCPAGMIDDDNDGLTACVSCGKGHFVPEGAVGACRDYLCAAGEVDDDDSAASPCVPCVDGKTYAPTTGLDKCDTVKNCTAGEDQIASPTLFADRICLSCVVGVTFKAEAGNDAACQRVTPCDAAQFETAAPTLTSDTVCEALRVCDPEDEYVLREATQTQNRECASLTECDFAFQFMAAGPTRTSDRQCQNVTLCDFATQYELDPPTNVTNRVCSPLTVCGANQRELEEPTQTKDRVCVDSFVAELNFHANFTEWAGTPTLRDAFRNEFDEQLIKADIPTSAYVSRWTTLTEVDAEGNPVDRRRARRDDTQQPTFILLAAVFTNNDARDQLYGLVDDGVFSVFNITATVCDSMQFQEWVTPLNGIAYRTCEPLTLCEPLIEYELRAATPTSDRVCKPCPFGSPFPMPAGCDQGLARTSDGGTGFSAGLAAVVGLLVIVAVLTVVFLVMWRRRKKTKDEIQEKVLESLANKLRGPDDMGEGNRLLRQLSQRKHLSGMTYDNPMFQNPDAGKGYLDVAPDWMRGVMSREEAEEHLLRHSGQSGDFLIRESTTNQQFVLSLLVDQTTFEHHRLTLDARDRFQLNNNPMRAQCFNIVEVVRHLAQVMDGTSVLLNYWDETMVGADTYGPVVHKQPAQPYGLVERDQVPEPAQYKQPAWMYGTLTRAEAEQLLLEQPYEGRFLVRAGRNPGTHVISMVLGDGRVEHHRAVPDESGAFSLNGERISQNFSNIQDLVHHLSGNQENMSRTLVMPADYQYADDIIGAGAAGGTALSNPSYGYADEPSFTQMPAAYGGGAVAAPSAMTGGLTNPGYMYAADSDGIANPAFLSAPVNPGYADLPGADASYLDVEQPAPSSGYDSMPPVIHDDDTYENTKPQARQDWETHA